MIEESEPLPNLTLTSTAHAAALTLRQENSEWSGKVLRLYLCGKNCDGFEYGVAFDQPNVEDEIYQTGDLQVLLDPDSAEFCRGAVIDWVDDERGRGFTVSNPRHKQFRGKFYKKKHWQEKLLKKREDSNGSRS